MSPAQGSMLMSKYPQPSPATPSHTGHHVMLPPPPPPARTLHQWVDYTIWTGCAIASFVPGFQVPGYLCASSIIGRVIGAINTQLIKLAVAPPTKTDLITGLSQGVAVASTDGIWSVKIGVLGFRCQVGGRAGRRSAQRQGRP